jgi:hypothetical protein
VQAALDRLMRRAAPRWSSRTAWPRSRRSTASWCSNHGRIEAIGRHDDPFVFATGYGAKELAERYRGAPITQKPFHRDDLERALRVAMARSAQSA